MLNYSWKASPNRWGRPEFNAIFSIGFGNGLSDSKKSRSTFRIGTHLHPKYDTLDWTGHRKFQRVPERFEEKSGHLKKNPQILKKNMCRIHVEPNIASSSSGQTHHCRRGNVQSALLQWKTAPTSPPGGVLRCKM